MGEKGKPQQIAHGTLKGISRRVTRDGEPRYRANIYQNGKQKWGPDRRTRKEAASDYDKMALIVYGKNAILNFPQNAK